MLSKSIRSRSTVVISGVVPTETQIHHRHRHLCVPLSLIEGGTVVAWGARGWWCLAARGGWWWWQVVVLGEMVMTCHLLIYASLTMFLIFWIFWVLMMMFDDVLEDIDLSLVSFYKSMMFLIFWVLMMKFDDVLDFLGFDNEV
ncbi:hypothetical protein HanIR_Chr13g0663911 [Helianthus annuus]|nr:hypothetical protein HanIR_Chr13g0663911 [Helianthus annuus]